MCHVSLDPMAATIRNFEIFNSGDFDSNFTTRNLFVHSTNNKIYKELPDFDPKFFETRPEGRVYFRDLRKRLIDSQTNSISDIGNTLSEVQDFYLCQTQRYLNYFLGKNLSIEEIDYKQPKKNTRLQNFLQTLAAELRDHGKIQQTIKRLIESPWYSEVQSAN